MPTTETLPCKAGHSFTRERTRGRKPEWCPEHRPVTPKPVARPTKTSQATPKAKTKPPVAPRPRPEPKEDKPKTAFSQTTLQGYLAEIQEVLDHPSVNDELKRKLRYVMKEMRKGRDEGLNFTRKLYLNEARRSMSRRAVVIVDDLG